MGLWGSFPLWMAGVQLGLERLSFPGDAVPWWAVGCSTRPVLFRIPMALVAAELVG